MLGSSLGAIMPRSWPATAVCRAFWSIPATIRPGSEEEFVGKNVSFEDGHAWIFHKKALESYEPLEATKLAPVPRLVIIGRNDILLDPLGKTPLFWKITPGWP